MAIKNSADLKSYFLTGSKPTQIHFHDFIDSVLLKSQGIMIDNTGKIGIGTNAPSEKMEINSGNLKISGSASSLTLGANDINFKRDGNFSYVTNMGTGGLAFRTAGNTSDPRMVIDGNGRIGIGTNAPESDLQLNDNKTFGIGPWEISQKEEKQGLYSLSIGKWKTNIQNKRDVKEIMINLNSEGQLQLKKGDIIVPLPQRQKMPDDYMFKPLFKLETLENLESTITTRKQFPDIPIQKDAQEDGLALGDLVVILLNKVAALTLYVIQLNNDIKKIKIRNTP